MRCLLLLTGVLLAQWLPGSWLSVVQMLLWAVVPLLLYWHPMRPAVLLVLGFAHAHYAQQQVHERAVIEPMRLLVRARIDSIPSLSPTGWQFDAQLQFVRRADLPPLRARLSGLRAAPPPQAGEVWQLAVQFSAPASAGAARALLRDHLSAAARVVPGSLNLRLEQAPLTLNKLRGKVAERIGERVADPASAALLAALAVGATGDVTTRQWQVFSATGITHLVAISGMHVTFFAMLAMALARLLWCKLPPLARLMRRETFAVATGLLLALGYALLSGFSVPAQRTLLMLAAFLVARQCARAATPTWSVAVALTAVLVYDPMAALSAGFWLSFLAVAAIVLVAGARLQQPAALRAAAQVQWLVTLALLPATLALFGTFSAVGMAANALAIPVFTFLLVPPVLLATLGYLLPGEIGGFCANHLVDLAAAVATALWPFLNWCAELPAGLWHAEPRYSWYFLVLPALALAVLPLTRSLRLIGVAALVSVFLQREGRPQLGELWVDVLDVGASTAVLLRTAEHLILYGTGEKFGSAGRSFAALVQPSIQRTGYTAVDLWLPGRMGRDAQSALLRGAALLPIRRVDLAADAMPPPQMHRCTERSFTWDDVEFFTTPTPSGRSCTLSAAVGGRQVLLAADVVADDAASLLKGGPNGLLLVLPRAAGAAAHLHVPQDALLVASLAPAEWNGAAWKRQRQQWTRSGQVVLATAAKSHVRLRLDANGRMRAMGAGVFGYHSGPCGNLC